MLDITNDVIQKIETILKLKVNQAEKYPSFESAYQYPYYTVDYWDKLATELQTVLQDSKICSSPSLFEEVYKHYYFLVYNQEPNLKSLCIDGLLSDLIDNIFIYHHRELLEEELLITVAELVDPKETPKRLELTRANLLEVLHCSNAFPKRKSIYLEELITMCNIAKQSPALFLRLRDNSNYNIPPNSVENAKEVLKTRFKEKRKTLKLSQRKLIKLLNNKRIITQKARTHITNIETGKLIPSVKELVLLSMWFGTSIDYLLGYTDEDISNYSFYYDHCLRTSFLP